VVDSSGDHPVIADQARTIEITGPHDRDDSQACGPHGPAKMLHEIGGEPHRRVAEKTADATRKIAKDDENRQRGAAFPLETPIGDGKTASLATSSKDKDAILPLAIPPFRKPEATTRPRAGVP